MAKGEAPIGGGDPWYRRKPSYRDSGGVFRRVFSRFWYLLVPLVAIALANHIRIRPELGRIQQQKRIQSRILQNRTDSTRVEVIRLQSQTVRLRAELDTLHLPTARALGSELEQLLAVRRMYENDLPVAQARIDSLGLRHAGILADIEAQTALAEKRSAALDSLRQWRATLADSVTALDDIIAGRSELLYRLQNPKEFRRQQSAAAHKGAAHAELQSPEGDRRP